jgi:hypothetical protein
MRREGGHGQEWIRARIQIIVGRVCMPFVMPSGHSIENQKAKIEKIEIGKSEKIQNRNILKSKARNRKISHDWKTAKESSRICRLQSST